MTTLKERLLEAEWAGYHWAMEHPDATREDVENACDNYYPQAISGVLAYAFERGRAMAREGKTPEPME
ncbi:hypothetical protein H7F10_08920 [Acidithiobacillus sp. HP-6]|uniref:hypothetical protein n=1 Tax=unclassified Acidithiobacillus TaxID=2614800 RepID=UPI0018799B95|nr:MULTISPECIES: hypothetical protein [unclassified Acidithiobacillus]MBE7563070.1 hypothetical protein [Acidithiobacillus sp. HP-6]MBE7570621.1 hypothetical protein [Acidithiobacillus sp. HP-2]